METIYMTRTFGSLPTTAVFTSDKFNGTYTKISTRKATNADGVEFAMAAKELVKVVNTAEMNRIAAFMAKPLFDGTEASCKTASDFYALDHARRQVIQATDAVDRMADYIAHKMADIKQTIRRNGAVDLENKTRYENLDVPASTICTYSGLNSLGELQGNGNIDALVMALHARREAFVALVNALGYRLQDKA